MNALKKLAQNSAAKVSLVAGSAMATGMAHAAGEGADAVSLITTAATTVAGIAGAVLAVYVSIKVFKLIRAAL